MKKISILLFVCCLSLVANAVPASPEVFYHTQPDGSVVAYRLVGDEYFHYTATTDGYALTLTADGRMLYDGTTILAHNPTERQASELQVLATLPIGKEEPAPTRERRRIAQQQKIGGGFPLTGSPRALVILVGFSDLPFEQTRQDFDDLLNKSGYDYNNATGSCRDYFIASSDSAFAPQFDVYGPYTASQNMAYYGEQVSEDQHDAHAAELIIEACRLAEAAGVDFSIYDTDSDNVLDNVFIYYAGHNQAEGGGVNTIWPHQSNLRSRSIRLSGKSLATYACTSEYSGANGTRRATIGTFCHEFGHVLGLPDFYDTDYKIYTVSNWDIMCSGSYNNSGNTPPVYTSYERFFLGWTKPVQLTEKGEYFLEPLETSNKAYLLAASEHNMIGRSPSPNEFFMLEYRQHVGWDEHENSLPGTGMLVWHIDYNATAWNNNVPNNGPDIIRMHLEEANGITWKSRANGESGRDSDPYPGTRNVTTFTPKLHNGTALSQQQIFNIGETTNLLHFTYISAGDAHLSTNKDVIEITTSVSDDRKIVDWEPQSFILSGSSLAPDMDITLQATSGNFTLADTAYAPERSNSPKWRTILTIRPDADSTLCDTIWVNFRPSKKSCTAVFAIINIMGDGVSLPVSVSGLAPRPQYVTTPELKPTDNVSPYSFRVSWEPVEDAVEYYLTLYSVAEGTSSFVQGFENFDSQSAVAEEGWESTTNTITTSAKADGTKSLFIRNTGDGITTEEYPAPITDISFWLNAFSTDADTVGYIDLEAWNGTEWTALPDNRTYVRSITKKKTESYSFDLSKAYTRFRMTYTGFVTSGVAMDAFTATCSQDIAYLHKGKNLTIAAIDDEEYTVYNVTGLTPSTTYCYRIQCSDLGKGCEEHLTALSAPVSVTTPAGLDPSDEKHLAMGIDSLNYDEPTGVVYIPNPENGNAIYVFDVLGQLVYTTPTYANQNAYAIPQKVLVPRNIYVIKYVENGKMKRKQRWVKFVAQGK